MARESPYRIRARRVIADVLAKCPVGTSFKDRRKAVSDAYPFSHRMGFAYKCWLSEVNKRLPRAVSEAMQTAKPKKPKTYEKPPDKPMYRSKFIITKLASGVPFWLMVTCEYCERNLRTHSNGNISWSLDGSAKSCLICRNRVQELAELLADPQFMGLLLSARAQKHPGPISDWLFDNGHMELSAAFYDIFKQMEQS